MIVDDELPFELKLFCSAKELTQSMVYDKNG